MLGLLLLLAGQGEPIEPTLIAPLPAPVPARAELRWPGSDAQLERYAKAAEDSAKKKDPLALARLYRLWNFYKLVDRPARVGQALETILKTPGTPALLGDHAAYLLAQYRISQGKLSEASALLRQAGLITDLALIGPFDNSAGRGHDEVMAPERGEGFKPVRGKAGPVAWRPLIGLAPAGTIELAELLHPSSEATAYLGLVVTAQAKSRVVLRVGASDQLAVFLDGRRIFARDVRREARLDQDAIPIELGAGPHLLLLKSSWLESQGELMVRFTAPSGGAAAGLQLDARVESLAAAFTRLGEQAADPALAPSPAPDFAFATVSEGVEQALKRATGAARSDALAARADLYAILALYDTRQLPSPPERDLEEAIRLDPADPMLRFFFAHRVAGRDPNLAQDQLEAALISDPGCVPAQLELGDMARAAGRLLEARAHFESASARDPSFGPAALMRATLGFDELAEGPLAALRLQAAPGALDTAAATLELARMRHSLGDAAEAKRLALRALELDFDRHLARHLAIELALDAGDLTAALSWLEQATQVAPFHAPSWLKMARVLAGAPGRVDEAIATLAKASAIFPSDPSLPAALAEIELARGHRSAALLALDHALEIDPHQPELRQHRRALSGERDELEDHYTLDPIAIGRAPVSQEEKRFGAITLAERNVIRLYGDGKSTRFRQVIFRLQNPRLKEALRVHRVDYSPSREEVEILSAERIRPNGEVLKTNQIGDDGPRGKVSGMYVDQRFKTIVFDDLDQGDMIHVRYRVDSIGSDLFGGFFGDIEALQSAVPKHDVTYAVITPKRLPLYFSDIGATPPVVEEQGDEIRRLWQFAHLDALEIEPYSPPYPQLGSLISVSTYKSWDALGAWYAKLYGEQLVLDRAAREAGRRAINGAKTEAEKIQRLYDYVVKNTRYVGIELGIHGWKPFPASETHRRRYGDCKDKSTLLAALLRDNGIDAALTLVRTADKGTLPTDLATMWAFNHAITYVPGRDLFLDPTAEFSGSTELPYPDQGAMALIVQTDGKTRITRLPESKAGDNLNSSSYVAQLSPTTELELEGVEKFFGARASQLRQEFEEVELRQLQIERQLGQIFEGARVNSISFSDLSDLEAPVEYGYSATVPRYGRLEGDKLVVPVALFQHQVANAYAQLATREHDLHLAHAWSTRNLIRYQLPSGAEIEALPESLQIDTPHLSLDQKVRRVEGGFETIDTVTIKSRIIPVADYAEFRRAALAVDRALARKVTIRW